MVWQRADASAMQYLPGAWTWVCVVPAGMARPDWIPNGAIAHEMHHHEIAYTWDHHA
jgi:hypothetical protein